MAVLITDTVLSLALVTYALEPSDLNAVFHGVLPTADPADGAQRRGREHDDLVALGVGDPGVLAVGGDRHPVRLVQRSGTLLTRPLDGR